MSGPCFPSVMRGERARWRRAHAIRLADVRPERVEWLWRGRVPRGPLTILDGDPDLGKSTVTLDLAARVATRSEMPDGTRLCSGRRDRSDHEDHLAATIRPRLDAAGPRHRLSVLSDPWCYERSG